MVPNYQQLHEANRKFGAESTGGARRLVAHNLPLALHMLKDCTDWDNNLENCALTVLRTVLSNRQSWIRIVFEATFSVYLHVQREEGEVGEESVAAWRRHQHAAERLCMLRKLTGQHGRRAMHHLLHVAAHSVQRQIVRRLCSHTASQMIQEAIAQGYLPETIIHAGSAAARSDILTPSNLKCDSSPVQLHPQPTPLTAAVSAL